MAGYERIYWEDEPSTNTPISAENLNKMDLGIANCAAEGAEHTTQIETMDARIDEIVALPDGSTTADAELVDIRVGAGGNTYNSAGTAVRTQIKRLASVSDTQPSDPSNRIWIKGDAEEVEIPTMGEFNELKADLTQLESDVDSVETAVSAKVNKPLTSPDGTTGQLLRSLGNGNTEWSNVGAPTDEQVGSAVTDWLDNHPEATTTVQDGSLTEDKFTSGALYDIKNGVYTLRVSDFGGYDDGTHEVETQQAINDGLAWAKNQGYYTVYIPEGLYAVLGYDPEKSGSHRDEFAGVVPPSNIHIIMDNNAIIKVATNGEPLYNAFYLYDLDRVIIEGGKVVGDRPDHDYTTISSTHEQGSGFRMYGCRNCVVQNVEIYNFTGDGFHTGSMGRYGTENYGQCINVHLINCNIYNCRRNGISTSGIDHFLISGCYIHDNGITVDDIPGVDPKLGIDIEGYSYDQTIVDKPYGIVVDDCFFSNNKDDISLYTGEKCTISNNHFESGIDCAFAYDCVISNNIFDNKNGATKIAIKSIASRESFNYQNNYTITGNVIDGYETGIYIKSDNIVVEGNLISNCTVLGISIYGQTSRKANQVSVKNNSIFNTKDGIQFALCKHISVSGNSIYSTERPFVIYVSNEDDICIVNNVIDTFTDTLINMNSTSKKLLFSGNQVRNCAYSESTGPIRINERENVDIINNVFENMTCPYIISTTNDSSFSTPGHINILGNVFKNFSKRVLYLTPNHTPIITVANNIFYAKSTGVAIVEVTKADIICSGIVGNTVFPDSDDVVLTNAIYSRSDGIGLIAKNTVLVGKINALNTDTLVDNYVRDAS